LVVGLNVKSRPIYCDLVHMGTATITIAHPREIYRRAIQGNAVTIIMAHNHPSGDPKPSQADRDITQTIYKAGEILNIKLVDHIIIGEDKYYSFKDSGEL
jgi:DNA repair protein RadC